MKQSQIVLDLYSTSDDRASEIYEVLYLFVVGTNFYLILNILNT